MACKIGLLFEVTIAHWILSGLGLDSAAIRNSWLHLKGKRMASKRRQLLLLWRNRRQCLLRRYAGTFQSPGNLPDESHRLKTRAFSIRWICNVLLHPDCVLCKIQSDRLKASKAQRKLAQSRWEKRCKYYDRIIFTVAGARRLLRLALRQTLLGLHHLSPLTS